MSIVLDASMTVVWALADEQMAAAQQVLRQVVAEGAIVPSIWGLEVANAMRSAVRRGRCDEAYVERSLARFARLPIAVDPETADHAWGRTRHLSRDEGLTTYDAAYLELALRAGASVASCDRLLIEAARRRGLVVWTA